VLTEARAKDPPLPSLVAVTAGIAVTGVLLMAVPGAASIVVAVWALYGASVLLLTAVAMGRDVGDAGGPAVVVGVLVACLPPLGVALWWHWRAPGPIITPFARRLMVGFVVLSGAGLAVLACLVAILHD